jgi:hypothetical protein
MSDETMHPFAAEDVRNRNARAALDRIRAAAQKHIPTWTGFDTDDGLAASVDTFIEVAAGAQKAATWYSAAMTRILDALGVKDAHPYYSNDAGIDQLLAAIETARRERVEAQQELSGVHAALETAREEIERRRKDIPTADAIIWRSHANEQIRRAEAAELELAAAMKVVERLSAFVQDVLDFRVPEGYVFKEGDAPFGGIDGYVMEDLIRDAKRVLALDAREEKTNDNE